MSRTFIVAQVRTQHIGGTSTTSRSYMLASDLCHSVAQVRALEAMLKRRILDHHGALQGLDMELVQSKLISVPSWEALDEEIGTPKDAHYQASDPAIVAQPTRHSAVAARPSMRL
jgi:hypothetical protein